MNHMRIDSKYRFGAEVPDSARARFTDMVIKNEPMLFNCSPDKIPEVVGALCEAPITATFLNMLPSDWLTDDVVVDSRSHMLMPGWYPCIPGWHHDDVPRERSDGQPQYVGASYRSEHVMMLVNSHVCPTMFAYGDAYFDEPPLGRTIYEVWHRDVEEKIRAGKLLTQSADDCRLIYFNDRTWHRGTAAVQNGWRFFIRASRYFDTQNNRVHRGNPRTNERRMQAQVYLPAVDAGW